MFRRDFLKTGATAASFSLAANALPAAEAGAAKSKSLPARHPGYLSWREGQEPAVKAGTTWGQAWPRGELSRGELAKRQGLCLINGDGHEDLAGWPYEKMWGNNCVGHT